MFLHLFAFISSILDRNWDCITFYDYCMFSFSVFVVVTRRKKKSLSDTQQGNKNLLLLLWRSTKAIFWWLFKLQDIFFFVNDDTRASVLVSLSFLLVGQHFGRIVLDCWTLLLLFLLLLKPFLFLKKRRRRRRSRNSLSSGKSALSPSFHS